VVATEFVGTSITSGGTAKRHKTAPKFSWQRTVCAVLQQNRQARIRPLHDHTGCMDERVSHGERHYEARRASHQRGPSFVVEAGKAGAKLAVNLSHVGGVSDANLTRYRSCRHRASERPPTSLRRAAHSHLHTFAKVMLRASGWLITSRDGRGHNTCPARIT